MALGISVVIASIIGIIYGVTNKKKSAIILSAIALILTIAVWVYFYNNPY